MPLSMNVFLCLLVLLIPASTFTSDTIKAWHRRTGTSTVALHLHATTQTHRNIIILSHNVSQDVADGLFDVNNLLTGRIDVLARCVNSALWVSNGIRKDTSVFLMLFPHNITIEIQGDSVQNLNPDERTMALFLQRTLLVGGQGDENKHALEESSSPEQWNLAAEQRREVELLRLQETQRKRPDIINPFKPGALPKSEKKAMRLARKHREAMVRRINRAGDNAPVGFLLHRDDTLDTRLKTFSSVGPILMLHELGEPLVDALASMYQQKTYDTTTTLILGDQIGYVASDEKLMAESDALRQVSLGPISLLTSQCITITQHYLDTAKAARV
jgi:tRNA pseudouridine-54 N-methylase